MAVNNARAELGRMLSELKERSGLSYQALGHKVHLSKSAVHRYCAGDCVPAAFATIEKIGHVTGATRAELAHLALLWSSAATDAGAQPVAGPVGSAPGPGPVPGPDAAGKAGPTTRARRRRRRPRLVAVASLATLFAAFLVVNGPGRTPAPAHTDITWAAGPAWTLPAEAVRRQMFGVTINSTTGNMPGFEVGAVRLWDSGTLWATLQPRVDDFNWTVLDRHIAGAEAADLPVLFVIGGTPGWAAPAGARGPYPEDARAAPPDDLAVWDRFVTALVRRYAGRIEAYELWVLATDKRFYDGTPQRLIDMTRRANGIIKRVDPRATVVCPGMGSLWTAEGRDMLRRFAELGGYDHCDVAGVKLYQRSAAEPPEVMLQLTGVVDEIMHLAGVHPRLWSTGTTYTIPLQRRLDDTTARNYAVRFFLVGLLARKSFVERMYFYNWGGVKIPIVLQADGGSPTPAARALEVVQRWLDGARVTSCGHGRAVGLPANAWQCQFLLNAGTNSVTASLVWTHRGTAVIDAGRDGVSIQYLDGTSSRAAAGTPVTIGEAPVLLTSPHR